MSSEPDFYEVVKYTKEPVNWPKDLLQEYLHRGVWPDRSVEHVGYCETKEEAEEWVEELEEGRTKDGWKAIIRSRYFS